MNNGEEIEGTGQPREKLLHIAEPDTSYGRRYSEQDLEILRQTALMYEISLAELLTKLEPLAPHVSSAPNLRASAERPWNIEEEAVDDSEAERGATVVPTVNDGRHGPNTRAGLTGLDDDMQFDEGWGYSVLWSDGHDIQDPFPFMVDDTDTSPQVESPLASLATQQNAIVEDSSTVTNRYQVEGEHVSAGEDHLAWDDAGLYLQLSRPYTSDASYNGIHANKTTAPYQANVQASVRPTDIFTPSGLTYGDQRAVSTAERHEIPDYTSGPYPNMSLPGAHMLQAPPISPLREKLDNNRVAAYNSGLSSWTVGQQSTFTGRDPPQFSSGTAITNTTAPWCSFPVEMIRLPNRSRKASKGPQGLTSSVRTPFKDEKTRAETCQTRRIGACVRCKVQKIRCIANPNDPYGPCFTCLTLSRPTLTGLSCLRYKLVDASLYRDQKTPNLAWTQRWHSMQMKNITEWASPSIKTIKVTQGYGNASYTLDVKEFVPSPGDQLEEKWSDRSIMKTYRIPPYAIADMDKAAKELLRYVDDNVFTFIDASIDKSDALTWGTYLMAYKYAQDAPREEERKLLSGVLRLWVTARMTSTAETICGDETLGMNQVDDMSSPWYDGIPIPPVMCAQLEIIIFSAIMKPLKKKVLGQLQDMVKANKLSNWFCIYLALFILLHSCALITRRDFEYARQILLQQRYANPESIEAHHMGATTILAHFHYAKKGNKPFGLDWDSEKLSSLAEAAELNAQQIQFIKDTSQLVKERQQRISHIRQTRAFGDDYYFLSQLFDDEWEPNHTV